MIQQHITRRKAIVAGTTAVIGTAGLALGTDRAGAQADVSTGDGLQIDDSEFRTDGPPTAVWAVISGEYSYRVDVDPDYWEVFLLVYDNGNSEAIEVVDGPATAREDTGAYALRGDLTLSSFYSVEDFVVPDGDPSRTLNIAAEVAFVLRDASDQILIQARAADSATVTVLPGGEMSAIGGSGEVVPQHEGDPTPTLPEA